ncbi:prolyl oligopeptidase family serine peptidase [Bergeyella zoohelcum]|uniref:prolyl oligopeptidase n=1 Tax=Bergeyella zoohelcum ATCC 43767 TaxID=883096 RepID=K1MRS9_9FLAO|nr:prolyl oligopeptidase family serine peptidase [Bergeyella zoohelcum]EKB58839.1 prolyl endopeptidase [Bergeyella zoohelcum ATCC 43767]SUV49341.1 Prolyl endopeptidase precursor [Bergeyella zoohelcum]
MYRKYLGIAAGIALVSCASNSGVKKSNMNYPSTKTVAHTDVYFGTEVKDPYRWLEDDRSAETKQWVKEQSEFTEKYLAKIPFREQMRKELRAIWNYEKVSAPFKEGKYEYFYKNNGLQPQAVLYRKSADGKTEVFLDPNTMSKDGTTSLSSVSFTKDGTLVAYAISEGGSDWVKIITMDVETKKIIGEPILAKFSGASWLNNEGFFYSKYDQPKDGSMLSGMTDMHQVYFHKLGTPSSQDERIIGGEDFKRRYLYVSVTDDQKYLILSAANATYGNEIYIRKASDKKGKFIPVQTGYKQSTNIIDNDGDTFYAITDKDAPNKKLVKFSLKNPSQWTTVIPETENVLSISTGGGYLFAKYIKDAVSYVIQYDYNGRKIREISLPGKGTAGGFSGKKTEKNIYFSFSNYIMPSTTYSYHVENGTSDLYYRPNVKFNPDDYISEQVFFTSKDGTKVPMMISYKKGLKKDGKNPTILYGYGGFNISLTPSFSVVNAIWMENGGIYAVPNLRGGGEYGKKWHVAGTKMQKRNVFEDFIAAGEYLQKNGYTSPKYMALSGRSNGGLLVGATMTMRPDLAKVAFPGVGVLDMLRYNQFTAGAGWAYDYGTAQDSKEMFEYLKGYSPVHNVHEGVCYPSTMVITGDHDDRVVPAHSFKFGAELQKKQSCSSPTLMRIEINAGHGAGRSTEQVIGENTDLLSFALYEMGIKALPKKK